MRERAEAIVKYYKNKYNGEVGDFATHCNIAKRTVEYWMGSGREKKKRISQKVQKKICSALNLKENIWDYPFHSIKHMVNILDKFKEIDIDFFPFIHSDDFQVTNEEEILLKELENGKTFILENISYESYSLEFLFKVANIILKNNDVKNALKVINYIQSTNSDFKYIFSKELNYTKALCFSHDVVKDWDSAIDILRQMYFDQSFRNNIEILTLLASNYKRKALSNKKDNNQWCSLREIDEELLIEAMKFYTDIYNSRKLNNDKNRYYDAINLYYLVKIAQALDMLYKLDEDENATYMDIIQEARSELRPDSSNWWESITEVEFFMLNRNTQEAISQIYVIFDTIDVKPFEIDATIRQIEMYVHFVDDKGAKEVLLILQDARKSISS